MSYWIDNSTSVSTVKGNSIDTSVTWTTGAHTVYVQATGKGGQTCTSSVAIIVVPDPATQVPADATKFDQLQALNSWQGTNDTGIAGGSASGTTKIVSSPSLSGASRQFAMQYTNYGGERYWVVFGDSSAPMNFLYDTWVYLARPSNGVANLEFDLDQVMSNGQTVIFGFQCDGYSQTWDYTTNDGTPEAPSSHWIQSQAACNARNWSVNTWHHVQITYSRDSQGTVTYQSVYLDGVEQSVNATVPSAFSLGWGPAILTNYQIDGYGSSGSSTSYLDNLTVYVW